MFLSWLQTNPAGKNPRSPQICMLVRFTSLVGARERQTSTVAGSLFELSSELGRLSTFKYVRRCNELILETSFLSTGSSKRWAPSTQYPISKKDSMGRELDDNISTQETGAMSSLSFVRKFHVLNAFLNEPRSNTTGSKESRTRLCNVLL